MTPNQTDVAALIAEYNQAPHFGLLKSRGMGYMTPLEVWNDARHCWMPGVDPAWKMEGVSILLS
jgi:hypothetical protein